jgi:phosphatidylglycerol:prolipoprotein diacylglycerol transferase
MYPEICKIGHFTIYSFGTMLVLAFLVASTLARRRAKSQNINPDIIFNLLFFTFIVAILGARFLYILQNIGYYLKNPSQIIMLQHGGLSWFGGLVFGVIFDVLYLKKKKLAVYKIMDLVIPFVALGQAIGRIGCLLNGCCFGKSVSKFGLYFDYFTGEKIMRIPTQLYSSLLLLAIFIILRFLQERPHEEGEIFFTYLLLYCFKRFFIEFWRADSPRLILNLTLFQIISLVIFSLALVKLILLKNLKN